MSIHKRFRSLFAPALIFTLAISSTASAQKNVRDKKELMPEGTPVLWQDPGDISARNLLEGPGGAKPDVSNLIHLKDEVGGYSVKYRVRDAAGRTWVAKAGSEARPETAATRLVWAVGYATEQNFLAPCVHIKGATAPHKKVDRCEGDGFANVRFEARPENMKRLAEWGWHDNPFSGTREFKGLIVMQALVNNWDIKDTNNKIVYVPGEGGAKGELRYIISDLGATFGKTGDLMSRSRNEPEKFVRTRFVKGVEGDRVTFHYGGKNGRLFEAITVEDAKWIGGLLSKLSGEQIADAFRAANYSAEEVRMLTDAVRARVSELNNLPRTGEAARRM